MIKAQLNLYLGLFFLVLTVIGMNLIIYGAVLLNAFNEPIALALNTILIGIIIIPIGGVFMCIFLYQAFNTWKKQKRTNEKMATDFQDEK